MNSASDLIHRVAQPSHNIWVNMYADTYPLTEYSNAINAYTQRSTHVLLMDTIYFPHGSPKHTHTLVLCPSKCSLLTCVEPPACGARAACHCLSSVMDVPFVANTHIHTETDTHTYTLRQRRGSARLSCPPKDEFLLCLGKRMWSHSWKIQPMSLATHDLIQASPLCRVPLPLLSCYFLLLTL